MESAEQPVIAETTNAIELSLKDYATAEVSNFNQALAGIGITPSASIVFGSAVHPLEVSKSTKLNPQRWDIDVLEIVDSIAPLRERPDQVIQTSTGHRYECIVAPSGGVVELQEIGAMRIKSPQQGLHLQVMEETEFLGGKLDPMGKKAFETGVLMAGQIPEKVKAVLRQLGVSMPKQPDEVMWSALQYSAPGGRVI